MWVDGGRRGSSENIIRVLVSSGPRGGWMPSCRGTCVGAAVDDYYYFYGQCYCCCKERLGGQVSRGGYCLRTNKTLYPNLRDLTR